MPSHAPSRVLRTALVGLGSVNRNLLSIIEAKAEKLIESHGVSFRIVAVADSSGVAWDDAGYAPADLLTLKEGGGFVRALPGFRPNDTMASLLVGQDCDLVLEASPVDLTTGEPGLSIVRSALSNGVSAVLANKGPLVLAFAELEALAKEAGAKLAYSATVCGGLPVVNVGRRDLVAAEVTALRGRPCVTFGTLATGISPAAPTPVAAGLAVAGCCR